MTLQVWMQSRELGAWEWGGVSWASFSAEMEQEDLEKFFPVAHRAV